jgi:clan AA aspartic protease (TIGR02281 family)
MPRSAIRRQGLLLLAALAAAVSIATLASVTRADPPAAASGASDVLTGKGLTKTGNLYVLPGEKDVLDGMRPLMVIKTKFDTDSKSRAALEGESQAVKAAISQADLQRRTLYQKLEGVKDATINNRIVGQLKVLEGNIDDAKNYKDQIDKKISALGDETREQYIQQVLDLSGKAEAVSNQYKDLAADADVKAALTAAKGRLGPSEAFTSGEARLKMFRKAFSSDVVQVKMDSGVPTVEVTINGKVTRTMTVDSGSSLVCIPADLAKDLALVPGPNDPEIIMQLADGKSHKARQMTLTSVRVGTFTVENVDCAVLEADLISAEPLLGGSFLQNFIYKLDPKAGELHLARTGGDAKGTVNTAGKAKPEMPAGK